MPTARPTIYTAPSGGVIDAGIASPLPAWRRGLPVNRLLGVGTNVPGVVAPTFSGTVPSHMGAGSDTSPSVGAGWYLMGGFSSAVYFEDTGDQVILSGGHQQLLTWMLGQNFKAAAPAFFVWDQPRYATAPGPGIQFYSSPSVAAALPSSRKIQSSPFEDSSGWDRGFPVAYDDWVYEDKLGDGCVLLNTPHGGRYATTRAVPAAVTGGEPILLMTLGPQGPFALGAQPSGVTLAEWFKPEFLTAGGTRRLWGIYGLKIYSKEWVKLCDRPDVDSTGFYSLAASLDRYSKRVYVTCDTVSGQQAQFYVDFTNGLSDVRTSAITYTSIEGEAPHRWTTGALLQGHPRRLLCWPASNRTSKLYWQNLEGGSDFVVDLAAQGLYLQTSGALSYYELIGMSYQRAKNRLIIVVPDGSPPVYPASAIAVWYIDLPPDLTNAAAYTVRKVVLPVDASCGTIDWSNSGLTQFYGKCELIDELNWVPVPFLRNVSIGFVPD